ncbi:nitroreductase family deazaflavin-dependent oxidoreductase [Nocardia sp. NPDC051787]|uniref:nitroreductase family deazaflavin-dependent oxidoreductase n=1 Tax=Nocardia sp. NPDC051787 TaxID=3155415 RepID=UPI00341A3B39
MVSNPLPPLARWLARRRWVMRWAPVVLRVERLIRRVTEGFVVLGSNWGSPEHPAWSANLRAAETASARCKGEQFLVTVREITGVERKRFWDLAVEFWPGYAMECELSGGRVFRIFELRRVSA